MNAKYKFDAFVSYNCKDKPVVLLLAERLKRDGVSVWFDEWMIEPGDPILLKTEQGLELSRTLVLFMSANAFGSKWVTLERHTAMFRDPANAQRRFIPVRLDDAKAPDILKQYKYVDWREQSDEEYAKLLGMCRLSSTNAKPQIRQRRPLPPASTSARLRASREMPRAS
jgi:hypothetical protein